MFRTWRCMTRCESAALGLGLNLTLCGSVALMPSVEMRRSTRVFVPKTKEAVGVKVLRSGRKVCVESGEAKIKTSAIYRLIGDEDEAAGGCKGKGQEGGLEDMVVEESGKIESLLEEEEGRGLSGGVGLDRRFGVVYSRKRKRGADVKKLEIDGVVDRRFGLHVFHRKRRLGAGGKKTVADETVADTSLYVTVDGRFGIAGIVSSVLRYMRVARVGVTELSQFFASQPISGVFGSAGVQFLLNQPCRNRSHFCKIYDTVDTSGVSLVTPVFDLDFLCAPLCFLHIHAGMWFRSLRVSSLLLKTSDEVEDDDSEMEDDVVQCTSSSTPPSADGSVLGTKLSSFGGLNMLSAPGGGAPRSVIRALPYRSGVVTRSVSQRKRKRSLRTRRARNPSLLGIHRVGPSILDSGIRKTVGRVSPSVSTKPENQKSVQKNSSDGDIKLLKSTLIALGKDIDSVSCSANLLYVDSDRCHRESGACVTLELSSSNEWILAIRKGGSLRCYHKAPKGQEVKPTCTNRFTYAIIWCVEGGWKLEFSVRKEWVIFKELFKVCGDRNIVPPSPAKAIPIPGVFEVSDCGGYYNDAPFVRPESYIKMNDDELSRTMLKTSSNYDMDSGDEEWLSTFKSKLDPDNVLSVPVPDCTFELMIDAFEKAAFSSPGDFTEDKPHADLCLDLASREVVEAIYNYWMTKRKQKCGPLLRVLQLNEVKKAPLVTKPVLRKKRSMKQRHVHSFKATRSGRGKELRILQAIAAEQNAYDEKTVMLEVEQARASAKRALDAAVEKRTRAQTLMASADLAMYRAAMAVRIAEAANAADPDQAAAHFLD